MALHILLVRKQRLLSRMEVQGIGSASSGGGGARAEVGGGRSGSERWGGLVGRGTVLPGSSAGSGMVKRQSPGACLQ